MSLSEVMRQAIDDRFAEVSTLEFRPDVREIVRGLFERHPDPPGLPPRDYDVHDRRDARAAIRRRLLRTRS